MSETTDLDKIAALETRIASALDRIARGIATQQSGEPVQDDESRTELEERVGALTAALEETQAALAEEQSAKAALQERLNALEAGRQADADAASREIAGLTEQVAAAQKESANLAEQLDAARSEAASLSEQLETAQTAQAEEAGGDTDTDAPEDGTDPEELQAELERQREVETVLRRRIARLRGERKAARADQNAAMEQLEEVQGKLDQLQALVDSSAPEASGELARLRESNQALRDTVEEMRESIASEAGYDPDLVSSALAAELESLRADRAAEAAEARAILSEIRPVLEGGQADA